MPLLWGRAHGDGAARKPNGWPAGDRVGRQAVERAVATPTSALTYSFAASCDVRTGGAAACRKAGLHGGVGGTSSHNAYRMLALGWFIRFKQRGPEVSFGAQDNGRACPGSCLRSLGLWGRKAAVTLSMLLPAVVVRTPIQLLAD